MSQRQIRVSLPTIENEIVTASEAANEIVWLERLIDELIDTEETPIIYTDNEADIKLGRTPNSINKQRTFV